MSGGSVNTTTGARLVLELDDTALERIADLVVQRLEGVTSTSTPARAVYTVATLAGELGMSERSVRGAINRGELEAKRRGRRYVIDADAVTAWASSTSSGRRTTSTTRPRRATLSEALARLEREA